MSENNSIKTARAYLTMAELLKSPNSDIQLSGEDFPDEIRERILSVLRHSEVLEIDMKSLRSMSPSFAYNAFGKLYDVLGDSLFKRIDFVNDVRDLKSRIVDAVERRQKIQTLGSKA